MSPKAGVTIRLERSMEKRSPREKLIGAIGLAVSRGTPLRSDSLGAVCGRLSGSWVLDRTGAAPGVNPIGALLLHAQEPPLADEAPEVTAGRVLGTPWSWAEGVSDGWARVEQERRCLDSALHRDSYLAGYFCGVALREKFSVDCPVCGVQRLAYVEHCPSCGVPR